MNNELIDYEIHYKRAYGVFIHRKSKPYSLSYMYINNLSIELINQLCIVAVVRIPSSDTTDFRSMPYYRMNNKLIYII